jgi:putative ABC transport system ATP-binding protein
MVAVTVLAASNLYRFYHTPTDEVLALRGVSLEVRRGEIIAIVGPSGSGKSTLLACLAGLDDPDAGRVLICGELITGRAEHAKIALRGRCLGLVFQDRNLLEHLTVRQNVLVGLNLAGERRRRDRDEARLDETLVAVGVQHRAGAYPSELSGGEAAKVALAVALVKHPPIVLADEPTAEVDFESERDILQILRRRSDAGTSAVIATHSSRVAQVADRILRLHDGAMQ